MTRDALLDELETCLRVLHRIAHALDVGGPTAHTTRRLHDLIVRTDALADAVSVATLRREYREKTRVTYRRRGKAKA